MKISLTFPAQNAITNHGYGVAGFGMVRALQDIGIQVPFQDPTAPVEIAFCQPMLWQWSNPDAYHIGYVPWESTDLPPGWLEVMKTADEIWTTSPWCKRVYEQHGLENVKVFLHGVDIASEIGWKRKRRRPGTDRPLRFLHMGEPAPRKGGQMAYDAFREAFGESDEVSLTIKSHGWQTVRGQNMSNVKVITDEFDTYQLIDLVHRHDVLVYPSYGEGFGLIPLQALATGMPTICTEAWAPYKWHLLPELRLPSTLTQSPWPDIHPGKMYEPDFEALKWTMYACADRETYTQFSARAYRASFDVARDFDWIQLATNATAHLRDKFSDD